MNQAIRAKSLLTSTLIVLLAACSAPALFAQEQGKMASPAEVILSDGSQLHGKIVDVKNGILTLATPAAGSGKVQIKLSQVKSLRSSEPVLIALADGRKIRGELLLGENGQQMIRGATGTPTPIEISKITAINPPVEKFFREKGNVTLNGSITDGNTRTKTATALLDYEARIKKDWRFLVHAGWNYAEDSGSITARNENLSLEADYFVSKRTYAYVNNSYARDDLADLNLRFTIGGGAGYQFLEPDLDNVPVSFSESAGVAYVNEDFVGSKNDYASARFAGDLNWDVLPDRLTVFHHHEFLLGLEDQNDLFADTRTGVRLTIIQNFYANFQVNVTWDNTPATGRKRLDSAYLWGLGYSFAF